jgi:hypothetical protein
MFQRIAQLDKLIPAPDSNHPIIATGRQRAVGSNRGSFNALAIMRRYFRCDQKSTRLHFNQHQPTIRESRGQEFSDGSNSNTVTWLCRSNSKSGSFSPTFQTLTLPSTER